tara:strand:- start:58 stop:411 length:354 start_codon:yes stop_codon:yes gene_type:complete
MNQNQKSWVPEIYYEEMEDGMTSHIPFISVPADQSMPRVLFIFESSETGEEEIGPSGDPLPIVELDLHQYGNMNTLRDNLPTEVYDTVRRALGLEPLSEATEKGKKITESIREKIGS